MIDFKLFGGFGDGQTDKQMSKIGDSRAAFANEHLQKRCLDNFL